MSTETELSASFRDQSSRLQHRTALTLLDGGMGMPMKFPNFSMLLCALFYLRVLQIQLQSIHEFLHSKRRNRLSFQKQRQLVNVYVKTKLREKMEQKAATTCFSEEEFSLGEEEPENDQANNDGNA